MVYPRHMLGASKLHFVIGFPETKLKCLQIVKNNERMEARELAKAWGIGIIHASKLLRDYWILGLLKREKRSMSQGGRRYIYSLSRAGEKKLRFLTKFKKSGSI